MAENAQKDLNEALPALEEAMKVGLYPICVPSFPSEIVFTQFAVFCGVFLHKGSGVSEQKGHDRDQVIRPSSVIGGDGYAGCHDPSGQGADLGGGQEAAW